MKPVIKTSSPLPFPPPYYAALAPVISALVRHYEAENTLASWAAGADRICREHGFIHTGFLLRVLEKRVGKGWIKRNFYLIG